MKHFSCPIKKDNIQSSIVLLKLLTWSQKLFNFKELTGKGKSWLCSTVKKDFCATYSIIVFQSAHDDLL